MIGANSVGGGGSGEEGGGGGRGGEWLTQKKGRKKTTGDIDRLKEEGISKTSLKNVKRRMEKNGKPKISRTDPYSTTARRLVANMTVSPGSSGMDATDTGIKPVSSRHTILDSPHTGQLKPELTLTVMRKDRNKMHQDDTLTVSMCNASAQLTYGSMNNGEVPFNITHATIAVTTYKLGVNSFAALDFFKNAIVKHQCAEHKGFIAYKPGEQPETFQIKGNIHRVMWQLKDKLHEVFAYGTGGAVKPTQVTQWKPAAIDPNGMVKTFLEIDRPAFEWLKSNNWYSIMGSYGLFWGARNEAGLTGFYKPDENPAAIKAALIANLNNIPAGAHTSAQPQDSPSTSNSINNDLANLGVKSVVAPDTDDEHQFLGNEIVNNASLEKVSEITDEEIPDLNDVTVMATSTPTKKDGAANMGTPEKLSPSSQQPPRKRLNSGDFVP